MAIYVKSQTPTVIIVYTVLTHISGVTYYVSATINPILYSIMSNKFREAFKDTLAHCCRRNSQYDRTSSRYTSVLTTSLQRNSSCNKSRRNGNNVQEYGNSENKSKTSSGNPKGSFYKQNCLDNHSCSEQNIATAIT